MFKLNHLVATQQPLPAQDHKRELTLADLDAVVGGGSSKTSGGQLFAHCCTGKHIPEGILHVR